MEVLYNGSYSAGNFAFQECYNPTIGNWLNETGNEVSVKYYFYIKLYPAFLQSI